jgi:methylated-DNA-[protein]-cysteine S-methyltransferase
MPPEHRTVHYRTVSSPIGDLTLAGVGSTLTHLLMAEQSHSPQRTHWKLAGDDAFGDVAQQLDAYFAGSLRKFDVDLRLVGTEFQCRVWAALQTIPFGETRSYGQIAEQVGSPAASRAVGLANGRNPVSIIVPCHRVIGSSGSLTGYGGGIERKRTLLELEMCANPFTPALFK